MLFIALTPLPPNKKSHVTTKGDLAIYLRQIAYCTPQMLKSCYIILRLLCLKCYKKRDEKSILKH
jgi:hypothetical protein